MWNLKSKTNEQTKQNRKRLIHTEHKLFVARDVRGEGINKIGKGDKEVLTSSY